MVLQRFIPSSLKLSSNQAVVRIHRVVLAAGASHFEARLLECKFLLGDALIIVVPTPVDRGECRIDAQWFKPPQDLLLDEPISLEPAEGDAAVRTMIDHRTLTGVAQAVALRAAVGDVELAPTVPTSQQTCK